MPTTYAIPNGRTVMDATLYTGNGSTQSITNAAGFQPDLVWGKCRSNTYNHALVDSNRGVSKWLGSNSTSAEINTVGDFVTAFNSNGFSLGSAGVYNANAETYVGWQWKANGTAVSNTSGTITSSVSANTTAGFSIVSYTGTGSAGTVGHGLGVAPQMIISKNRSAAEEWRVASIGLTNMASWHMNLNGTGAQSNSGAAIWNNTTPTSTIFGVGTDASVSGSGNGIIAYCWTPIAGFSQFGSYTGNGSADGPFVYTGFRPKWLLIKQSSGAGFNWNVIDTSRSTYNEATNILSTNTSDAEVTSGFVDVLSNGFKVRNSSGYINASAGTYIYMSFAENPTKFANAR